MSTEESPYNHDATCCFFLYFIFLCALTLSHHHQLCWKDDDLLSMSLILSVSLSIEHKDFPYVVMSTMREKSVIIVIHILPHTHKPVVWPWHRILPPDSVIIKIITIKLNGLTGRLLLTAHHFIINCLHIFFLYGTLCHKYYLDDRAIN